MKRTPDSAAQACPTGDRCVIITLGETTRHLTRDEAERFAAEILRACFDSCKAELVKFNDKPSEGLFSGDKTP